MTQPTQKLRIEAHGSAFVLVVPVPSDMVSNGFHSTSVLLERSEVRPRIIERHLRVLGWSRSAAKRLTNDVLQDSPQLLSAQA